MIKRYAKKSSAVLLVLIMLCYAFPFIAAADEGEGIEPSFISDAGIKYHLEGPGTMVVELDLLGEHTITLTDGEEGTVEWNCDVPPSVIGSYPESFTYGPATYSRTIYIVITNNLVMHYSREAFEAGEQFLTGVLTQHIVAYERLSSSWPAPVSYNFDQVELVISELKAGNFECIAEGSLPISFSVTSDTIVNSFNPTDLTFLNTRYNELELISDYAQEIGISPDFIISIIEDPVIIEEVFEELIEQILEATPPPSATPEEMVEAVEEVQTQAEEIIEEYLPVESSPAAAAAGAVASALAVGLAGAAAAVVSGASSGAAGAAASGAGGVSNALSGTAAGISQAAQTIAQSSAAASGSIAFTFIKDILTGLRDMLMDEGRSQASGWVTENLKK